MKILFYGAKPYDTESFDQLLPEYPGLEVKYIEANLVPETAPLAQGYEAVCAFVNADLSAPVSYTHLDVYKRQPPIFCARTGIPVK